MYQVLKSVWMSRYKRNTLGPCPLDMVVTVHDLASAHITTTLITSSLFPLASFYLTLCYSPLTLLSLQQLHHRQLLYSGDMPVTKMKLTVTARTGSILLCDLSWLCAFFKATKSSCARCHLVRLGNPEYRETCLFTL
jgi:hypothetical protein